MTRILNTVNQALGRQRFWRRGMIRFRRLARYITPPVYVLLFTFAAVILFFPFTSTLQSIALPQVGEAARETVIAPFTFDVLKSPDELMRERKAAAEKVPLVVEYDSFKSRRMRSSFQQMKKDVAAIAEKRWSDSATKSVQRQLLKVLSENALTIIVKHPSLVTAVGYHADAIINKGMIEVPIVSSREQLRDLQNRYNVSFDNAIVYPLRFVTMRRDSVETAVDLKDLPLREVAFETVMNRLRQERRFDADTLNAAYELLAAYVQPNVTVSETKTAELRAAAAQDVLAISGKVIKDTEIVRKHQEVTPEILKKMRSLRIAMEKMENVQERNRIWSGNIGRLILVLLGLVFLAFYVRRRHPVLLKNPRHLIAFALALVSQVLIVRLCMLLIPRLFESGADALYLQPEYLVPTAAAAMLSAILFGQELSFVLVLYVSTYLGIVLGFNQFLFVYALFTGFVAVVSSRNIRYRWEYFKIIPAMLAVALVCITMWHLINFKFALIPLFQNFGLAAVNVALSLLFAMAFSPLFEHFFDITTNMTLVELSDMNHPVLKRLSIEAAGTYNHSVLVGNLAESAAEKIGANPLLARVASYYHDIGKIDKADYFVENALGLDKNRHNKLAPSMSALIILSHVKEGVELARRYKLPAVIKDVITQHHGTGWVSFFYEKALEQDPHKQVQEQDFRYPGPPPQTRETAIIMLADSVEAASRSLGTSSPKLLRELVKKIIRDKFMDGQLDQCTLTLRDLDGIVEGFMPVLQGMFHSRIKYPNQ